MKSYTDINQSKKLAEILPIESADMYYGHYDFIHANTLYVPCNIEFFEYREITPCWSLSALLNTSICSLVGISKQLYWYCEYVDSNYNEDTTENADNPIDACYNLILKLHELNLL